MKVSKRIDTSGAAVQPINAAFASLEIEGLPDAPPEPEHTKKAGTKKMRLILRRETSHRAGKTVVVVSGFPDDFSGAELEQLARTLKKKSGCGGTVAGCEIEVQGDQPRKVRTILEQEGFSVGGVT